MRERAKALADRVESSSVALYRHDETNEPLFEASGFYLAVGARLFFVTAAHSIRGCDGRAMLLTGGGNQFYLMPAHGLAKNYFLRLARHAMSASFR
ncbi:MAG: hypothetical protein ACREOG_08060 [Gemmatimonadaceae bacterium]